MVRCTYRQSPVISSLCSVKEAKGMYGLLTSHTATTLSRNREQLWGEVMGYSVLI